VETCWTALGAMGAKRVATHERKTEQFRSVAATMNLAGPMSRALQFHCEKPTIFASLCFRNAFRVRMNPFWLVEASGKLGKGPRKQALR
jgi:hypothetical protein